MADVHTVVWILELIGISSPAVFGTWILAQTGEHSIAILVMLFAVILAATVVIVLAALGQEQPATARTALPPIPTPAPQLPAVAPTTITPEPRIFVDITPSDLLDMIKGKMVSEAARITAPFVGKWIKTSVTVHNIDHNPSWGVIYGNDSKVACRFNVSWKDKLDTLRRNQTVQIIGKIDNVQYGYLALENCEFT